MNSLSAKCFCNASFLHANTSKLFCTVPALLARWFKETHSPPLQSARSPSGFRSLNWDVSNGRERAREGRQTEMRQRVKTVQNRRRSVHTETQEERETVRREVSVSDRGERIDRCVWRHEDSRRRDDISISVQERLKCLWGGMLAVLSPSAVTDCIIFVHEQYEFNTPETGVFP